MSCRSRLDKSFENAPILELNEKNRYVLFSDCHRGNGTHNDNFLKNQHIYFAALKYYFRENFSYIELGDGDELWECRNMKQIIEVHSDVFWELSLFHKENRLYMLYGNHDMQKKDISFVNRKCSSYFCSSSQKHQPLFPDFQFHAGIILQNPKSKQSIYLTHGHQASLLNSTFWRLGRFLVRYVWKPLEQIGVLDPTSAAKNYSRKQRSERQLDDWASRHNHLLITGHTHRPMLQDSPSLYLNTGSCVHPRCITCIEITDNMLKLVKWYMSTREHGTVCIDREVLTQRTL